MTGTFDDYTFIAFTLSDGPNGLQSAMVPTAHERGGLLGTCGPSNAFGIDTTELRFQRPGPADPGGLPIMEVIDIPLAAGTVVGGGVFRSARGRRPGRHADGCGWCRLDASAPLKSPQSGAGRGESHEDRTVAAVGGRGRVPKN